MGSGTIVLIVILGIVLVLVVWFVAIYNGLVGLKNQVKNAWSQIDVQLKRRHDLIPNLVETVKGYASHEKDTLERVVQARSRAMGAKNMDERIQAEGELGQALGRLMLLVENYPDLKANQNFLALQEELTSTENKISFARQFYNDSVMTYNNKIQMFPSNVIAGMFNFKEAAFFKVENEAEREAPKVQF